MLIEYCIKIISVLVLADSFVLGNRSISKRGTGTLLTIIAWQSITYFMLCVGSTNNLPRIIVSCGYVLIAELDKLIVLIH